MGRDWVLHLDDIKSVFTPQKTMVKIFGRTRSLVRLYQGKETQASREALVSFKQRNLSQDSFKL